MRFQESQTFLNLQTAYQNELCAATRYRLAGLRAVAEGQQSIAGSFQRMSHNAMMHAAVWQRHLRSGTLPDILQDLQDAAQGEFDEWTWEYRDFGETARQEGFTELAALFDRLADIARYHNVCFCRLADRLAENRMFTREEDTVWICLACGYVHIDCCAPAACPVCKRPQGWFEVMEEERE